MFQPLESILQNVFHEYINILYIYKNCLIN